MNLQMFGGARLRIAKICFLASFMFLAPSNGFAQSPTLDRDAGVPLPAGMPGNPIDDRPVELVNLRILHTNDIHSQFHPEESAYGLGGLARMSTAIRRARAQVTNSILVDGGDWSEGKIYYRVDGGRASLEMMNALHYDAAVLGNHDWLNGPGQLLEILQRTPPQFALLGANLKFSPLRPDVPAEMREKVRQLRSKILPYTIKQVGPMKIGIIGICTYELVYDPYIAPIKIEFPFPIVNALAHKLRAEDNVDIVMVISHNSLATNREIAVNPDVDVVIHAHDHMKLNQPIVVPHQTQNALQNPFALIVEAGQWGRYLGIMDLQFDVNRRRLFGIISNAATDNFHYRLYQIDDTTPPDPAIETQVSNYDNFIESLMNRQGEHNIFHDQVATTLVGIDSSGGYEPFYGNLLADAYREYAHADIAFEQINLTSGAFYIGAIHTADIINALGQIFNPVTQQAWRLSTMIMTGRTVEALIGFLFFIRSIVPSGIPSVSGLHILYNPAVLSGQQTLLPDQQTPRPFDELISLNSAATFSRNHGIVSIDVGGVPLNLEQPYKVAISQGLVDSIDFMARNLHYTLPRINQQSLNVESWRVLRQYLQNHSPISANSVNIGNRYQSLQPDLAIYSHDIDVAESEPGIIEVEASIHNYGGTSNRPRVLVMGVDATPADTTDDPNPLYLTEREEVPSLGAGQIYRIRQRLHLPPNLRRARRFPVYVKMNSRYSVPGLDDQNASNDVASVIFNRDSENRHSALRGRLR